MEKSDKTEIVELKQDPITMEKGFRKVYGEDGTFVCNVIDTNGRLHSVFGENMADRLESYRHNFPVFEDDLYLLTYPKSGGTWYTCVVFVYVYVHVHVYTYTWYVSQNGTSSSW